MSFDSYGASQNEGGGKDIDWNALNQYVVETAQLETKEVLVGYVAQIVDLGTQKQQDAEVVFVGTEEDERKAIAEMPNTYFKDGKHPETKQPCRFKCWPQKDVQSVVVAVDFPDIILDKGAFFGESKPLPLRLWLGGQFYNGEEMVVGRPIPLKVNKKLGDWSFDKKHLFHKMAVSAKLIGSDECFLPQQIDQLLGRSFQFEAQVFWKENKGKKYYTEYVKFIGGLGRGQSEPELKTEPYLIQFNKENPEDGVKELRAYIINTMKKATNYEGSQVQKDIEKHRPSSASGSSKSDSSSAQGGSASEGDKSSPAEAQEGSVGNNDKEQEDIPF